MQLASSSLSQNLKKYCSINFFSFFSKKLIKFLCCKSWYICIFSEGKLKFQFVEIDYGDQRARSLLAKCSFLYFLSDSIFFIPFSPPSPHHYLCLSVYLCMHVSVCVCVHWIFVCIWTGICFVKARLRGLFHRLLKPEFQCLGNFNPSFGRFNRKLPSVYFS